MKKILLIFCKFTLIASLFTAIITAFLFEGDSINIHYAVITLTICAAVMSISFAVLYFDGRDKEYDVYENKIFKL